MARCLLTDIPLEVYQVLLHHLGSHDHASLRLVSPSVNNRTTPHVPYITLHLSSNSSTDQVQQWCHHAAQSFQHVTNIHIHVTGQISIQVFELAIQLLSQRIKHVTGLQLLAVVSNSSHNSSRYPCISTLLPLQQLMPHLQTLVIQGVVVGSLDRDMQQLAAAASAVAAAGSSWQLQNLTLNAGWCSPRARVVNGSRSGEKPCLWSEIVGTIKHLTEAFPCLKQLAVQLPPVGYHSAHVAQGDFETYHFDDDDDGDIPVQQVVALFGGFEMWAEDVDQTSKYERATAAVATVAALADAAAQLKSLEMLTVTDVPDIWKLGFQERSAVARAAEAAGAATAVAESYASLDIGLLQTTTEAAAAFSSLNACGCWLLKHNPALNRLQISTARSGFDMAWQRSQQQQQQQQQQLCNRGDNKRTAAAASDASTDVFPARIARFVVPRSKPEPTSDTTAVNDGDSSSSNVSEAVSSILTRQLSHYSSRPTAELLPHIYSLKLELSHREVHGLADLLGHLKSLKRLDLTVLNPHQSPSSPAAPAPAPAAAVAAAAAAAVAAAAAAPSLQTLIMKIQGRGQLPHDLLLPLTAAAGGPCSSLKKLVLNGDFTTAAAVAEAGNDSSVDEPSCLSALKQLTGLCELAIIHTGDGGGCKLTVESLPASIRDFHGHKLLIDSAAAAAAAAAAGTAAAAAASSGAAALGQAIGADPNGNQLQLNQLCLAKCQLSSPSILASDQLQQLTVIDTSWPGGWAAAAAAWPNLCKLAWRFDRTFFDKKNSSVSTFVKLLADDIRKASSSSSSSYKVQYRDAVQRVAKCLFAKEVLQQIAVGFRHLTSLIVQQLPLLPNTVDPAVNRLVLRPVAEHMKHIRHVNLAIPCYKQHQSRDLVLYALISKVMTQGKILEDGSSSSSSSRDTSSGSRVPDAGSASADSHNMQQWLQQQMPWARVYVKSYML